MNSRDKIILNCKQPTTIKDLQQKTGLKWANLSRHLTRLREKGWIMEVGKDGKSKVIQLNKYKYDEFLKTQEDKIDMMKSMLE